MPKPDLKKQWTAIKSFIRLLTFSDGRDATIEFINALEDEKPDHESNKLPGY